MSYIIGLTGGIGCGKSLVSDYLQSKHYTVIDADKIARQIMEPGQDGLKAVQQAFGDEILQSDGTLNRAKLGEWIFREAKARQTLDDITHPLIEQRILQAVTEHREESLVIVDVPLLLESGGYDKWVDEIWVVIAEEAQQKQRIMARDNLSDDQAQARIDAQWPTVRKIALADVVIDNSQSKAHTYAQIDALLNQKQAEILAKRF